MNVTCDPKKDALNIRNHHISLNEAKRLEWDTFVAGEDARFAYGEMRMVGFGYIVLTLYCLVYVEIDDENWRAISLRTATKREINDYAKA
ncbi:MAG: hypothetical protein BWK73_47175 [Thiothrix lacustris]|uniref:BrnT family toxin n=1 Tax=Thiothrix lacustris TaxID=525917 RepID=A0A1Y1Q9Z9_9GAMM|nr:MAG: hypothetical protein BWK73_47175 [Thiothrix lacustris]